MWILFYYMINIFEFSYFLTLFWEIKLFEEFGPFLSCFLALVGSIWSRTISSPLLKQNPFKNSTWCPMNYEVFQSKLWKQALFLVLCEYQVPFPLILPSNSLFLLGSFFIHMCWLVFRWIFKEDCLKILRVFFLCSICLSSSLPCDL